MAEASYFWATTGTGDGTGAGYSAANLFTIFRALLTGSSANAGGVAPDYLNKLAVSGTATPVTVATGAALAYGCPYVNDVAVTVAIATPTTSTRIDRIVLRVSWAAQTVRITRIAGTEGAGAPSMTQSAGTTWDVPLATVSITTGGVITVTDAREWILPNADGAVATAKLADSAVTTAKIADANVTTAKILDANVTYAKLIDQAAATVMGRASGAGTGDTTALTAAQLITILLGADGSGTLLDADLLDGLHATEVAASRFGAESVSGVQDWNDVTNTRPGTGVCLLTSSAANGPPGSTDWFHALNFEYLTKSGNGQVTQIAIPYSATLANLFIRGRSLGIWSDWKKIWTESSDGAGSGLDADTVDGSHASSFAASSHTHGSSGLDANAVTTAKILDANVTTGKLADGAVTTAKIADANVTTAKIADANVTYAKLIDQAQTTVLGRAAAAGTGDTTALTAAQLVAIIATADGTGTGLDADTVDGSHASAFAASSHTHGTSGIDDDAVSMAKLANIATTTVIGRVTAGTGDPSALTAAQLLSIVLTVDGSGSTLDADTVDGSHASSFAASSHTHGASGLDANAVTTGKILDANVTTAKIADGAVTTAKLATGAVTTVKIVDANVTYAKLPNQAQSTILGRAAAAGTGDTTALTAAQVFAILADEADTQAVTLTGGLSGDLATTKWGGLIIFTGSVYSAGALSDDSPLGTIVAAHRPGDVRYGGAITIAGDTSWTGISSAGNLNLKAGVAAGSTLFLMPYKL